MKFANFDALKRVTAGAIITKNLSVLLLRTLILVLLIFAAAGTIFWYEGESNENDFVVAIDVSASMSAQDIEPTRLEAAKQEAITFVDNLQSQGKIGLVSFGGVSIVENTLSESKRIVQTNINELELQESGGTDIAGAIITSTNLLLESEKGKIIILLTDGSNTAGALIDNAVERAIDYAKDKRIKIHTIGFGTTTGPIGYLPTTYNVSAIYNEGNLLLIANQTNASFYRAKNQGELRNAYQEISNQSAKGILHIDLSYALLLIALLLIFVEWGLINTRFRRIP